MGIITAIVLCHYVMLFTSNAVGPTDINGKPNTAGTRFLYVICVVLGIISIVKVWTIL